MAQEPSFGSLSPPACPSVVAAAASQSRSAAVAAQQVSTASSTAPSGVAVPTFLSPGGTLKPTARRANGEPIAPVGGELQTSADIVRLFMKPDKRKRSEDAAPASASGLLPTAYDLVTAPDGTDAGGAVGADWLADVGASAMQPLAPLEVGISAFRAPPRKGPHLPAMAGPPPPSSTLPGFGLDGRRRVPTSACATVCAAIRCCSPSPPTNARRRHGRGGGGFRVECSGIPRQSTAAACTQTAVASPRRPPLQISPRRPGRRDSQHCPSLAAGRSSLATAVPPASSLRRNDRAQSLGRTRVRTPAWCRRPRRTRSSVVAASTLPTRDPQPSAAGQCAWAVGPATSSASCQAAQRLLRTLEMLDVPPLVQTKAAVARLAPPAAGDSGADSAATPAPPLGFDGGSARSTGAGQACLSALSAAPPTRSCVDMTPASTATSRAGGPLADSPALFGTSSASGATGAAASATSRISSKAPPPPSFGGATPGSGAPKPSSPASMVSERRAGR